MRAVIISKSDNTGGAAVVSRRLMEALRENGVDAHMLVCEKQTDSPFVELAAKPSKIKSCFLLERIKIFIANGFNRSTLFRIDTGEIGLPLWKHPLVKSADAVLINWVNQGMLSLHGVKKVVDLGKTVIWTMHDMWEMTGICHHAGKCRNYEHSCGDCYLLCRKASTDDLSFKVWGKKRKLYEATQGKLIFVAVSNWLKERSKLSSLLSERRVEVIHNAFPEVGSGLKTRKKGNKIRLLFGAARIDDPIKGIDTLKATSQILRRDFPEETAGLEIALFGAVKDPESLKGFGLPVVNLGILKGEWEVEKAYEDSDIVVSASSYETLPGTLVEAQAYGCVPVSFNRGGQKDIIEDGITGFLVDYDEDLPTRAAGLAKGILRALGVVRNKEAHEEIKLRMRENVNNKFSYRQIARQYISLIR